MTAWDKQTVIVWSEESGAGDQGEVGQGPEVHRKGWEEGCLSVKDGITTGDEGTTAVAAQPPRVVGQAPVRGAPSLNGLGGQEDEEDQSHEEHQKLEHLDF